jgi:hypothetical protein
LSLRLLFIYEELDLRVRSGHVKVAAATAELAIPHFATASIFAAGAAGASLQSAKQPIQILLVRKEFHTDPSISDPLVTQCQS